MNVEKLQERVDKLDESWKETQAQLQAQLQMEYGAYMGQRALLMEMIEEGKKTDSEEEAQDSENLGEEQAQKEEKGEE